MIKRTSVKLVLPPNVYRLLTQSTLTSTATRYSCTWWRVPPA